MLVKKLQSFKWVSLALLFMLSTSVPLLIQAIPASAIECDGSLVSEDCPVVSVGPTLTGNYRTVSGAIGMYPDEASDSFTMDIPACAGGPAAIIDARLYWSLRDFDDLGWWDESVDIAVDAGSATTVTSDRRYKAAPGSASIGAISGYIRDITSDGIVQPGSHTYTLSNLTESPGAVSPYSSPWGFGISVVYECPEYSSKTIVQKEGNDVFWYGWAPQSWSSDRSELVCETFTASASPRIANANFFVPGSSSSDRQADVWYSTGTGTAPSATAYDLLSDVNTPANGGTALSRLIFTGEPELEVYNSPDITIPAGDTFLCIQIDASFQVGEHPDNATAWGASMMMGAGWFIWDTPVAPPPPPGTLSLGDLVWNDENNNGMVDGSEAGICNVEVELYNDVNNDNAYNPADDGSTPIQTQTTGCVSGSEGSYNFTGLSAGNYCVVIPQAQFNTGNPLFGFISSTGSNGITTGTYEPAADPDGNINNNDDGSTTTDGVVACGITLALSTEPIDDGDTDNNTNLSVDFGLFNQACLGDFVWYDRNGNGLQDSGEEGVEGVVATLHNDSDDSVVTTKTTDSNGAYMFCGLTPGSYYVVFSNLPEDYSLVSTDGGNDDALDSDIDQSTFRTPTYTLAAGETNTTVDGGIVSGTAVSTTPETTLANTGLELLQLVIIGLLAVNVPILVAKSSVNKYKRAINRF